MLITDADTVSRLKANAGPAHRVTDRLVIYEGIGYSAAALAWELAPS